MTADIHASYIHPTSFMQRLSHANHGYIDALSIGDNISRENNNKSIIKNMTTKQNTPKQKETKNITLIATNQDNENNTRVTLRKIILFTRNDNYK